MGSSAQAEVTLLGHRFSPYAQRVHLALVEKRIPFELLNVDLSNKPELLQVTNPIYNKVPAIIHDGKPLAESLVILEYLEDAWPEQVPLMPKDAYEKSIVRFWTEYMYKFFDTLIGGVRSKPGSPEKQAAVEEAVKNMKTLEETMVNYSADGPFFTGDKFGFLDLVLSPFVFFLPVCETFGGLAMPGPDDVPRFHKWLHVMQARPSVISTYPSEEESVKFFAGVLGAPAAPAPV